MTTDLKNITANYSIFIFFLFLPGMLFGQTKVDKILSADKSFFIIKTSGCFGGGADTITIVRQSSGDFNVFHGSKKNIPSIIDQSQLLKFSETFKEKMTGKQKCACTLSSTFVLFSKKGKVSFHTRCCGQELPSETFRRLLNAND
ncbi:MAG: hypothetical protein IPL10_08915 [Bacteroidetes bacterium]|nr:hypothetical protein [Bacteroidota bacterium]